jgi:hypothetical protein
MDTSRLSPYSRQGLISLITYAEVLNKTVIDRGRLSGKSMHEPHRRRSYQVFTDAILPILAIVATLVAPLRFSGSLLRWLVLGLVALALLSILIGVAPRIWRWFAQQRAQRREQPVCIEGLNELRDYIGEFEACVSTRRSDTLNAIVFGKLCGSTQVTFDSLGLAPPQIFSEFWEQIQSRASSQSPNFMALYRSVSEFNTLVVNLYRYTARPLYEIVPAKLKFELTRVYQQQGVEDDLTLYRERFNKFMIDYGNFLKKLDKRLPQPLNLGYPFQLLNPLKPVPTFVNGVRVE